jgi:type IV secretion system protein VirD4
MRLILNQIGRRLTERLDDSGNRYRLLLMLDEFAALGRLDFFESQLAFMAGYGIRAFLIAQSLNQLDRAYGANHAILDNCHVRVAFATNDERTAKRVSDALGTATETRDAKNYAGHRLAPWLGHLMVSRQESARPLLTPGEVMQLPPDDALVLISGLSPIRAKKARYFTDPQLARRILEPPILAHAKAARSSPFWHALPKPVMLPEQVASEVTEAASRSFAPLEPTDNWDAEQRHPDTERADPNIEKHVPAALREAADLGFPT